MYKFNSNSQLKVDGKMTPEGADKVGQLQAIAWIIIAIGLALALIIGAITWVMTH